MSLPRFTRRLALVAGALTLPLATAACMQSGESESSSNTLRIAHTASGTSLSVIVADKEGFFEDHGFETELTELTTTSAAQTPNLVGRQFDIGFATEPILLNAIRAGVKVTVVGGTRVESSAKEETLLVGSPDAGVQAIKDLEGKTIAAPSIAGNLNIATQAMLADAGVDVDKVKFVQLETGNMADALAAGRVQAAEVTSPVSGALLADGYVKLATPTLAAVGDPVHQATWIASSDWANDNPEQVENFVAALDDANAWIEENPDEAVDLVIENAGIPESMKKDMILSDYSSHYPPEDLKAWAEVITQVTGTKFDIDFDAAVAPAAR